MIKIEKTETVGWEHAIRGMRNPLNSWSRSDSIFGETSDFDPDDCPCHFKLGSTDFDLMKRLRNAGTPDRKFMRMIVVYTDITAPLYWWKEFDTYKVGTVANSCSTMHKLTAKDFEWDDFSHEHMIGLELATLISSLNGYLKLYRQQANPETRRNDCYPAKELWYNIVQLLPTSYNQKRTVMLNYEVLSNIYQSRKNHKLDEWRDLCKWIETLPYSQLITGNFEEEQK